MWRVTVYLHRSAGKKTDNHKKECRVRRNSTGKEVDPLSGAVFLFVSVPYLTCAMKFPIFSAACSCICRVAWA